MSLAVLLIEDDLVQARQLKELLAEDEGAHFRCRHVGTLGEALALLSEQRFDVVVLDLSLPDSAGWDTIKAVLRVAADVAVVVHTGHGDERLAAEALQRGAQDYIVKGRSSATTIGRVLRFAVARKELARRAERDARQLEATRAELATVLSTNPVPTFVLNEGLRVLRANQAAAHLVQRDECELVGRSMGDALRCWDAGGGAAPGGCGRGVACAACPILEVVTGTLTSGTSHRAVGVALDVEQEGGRRPLGVQLSTARLAVGGRSEVILFVVPEASSERGSMTTRRRAS